MRRRLWINLFIKLAVIFIAFVVILTVANSTLLINYFTFKQENLLAERSREISNISHKDPDTLENYIWELKDRYNFETELYDKKTGRIICTTKGAKMLDFFSSGLENHGFDMNREKMDIISSKTLPDGAIIQKGTSRITKDQYLLCSRTNGDVVTEVKIRISLLENSATVASEFISIVAAICFVLSLIWVFVFARKFSAPISEMSVITGKMSDLDFSKKVNVTRKDEIGLLGSSINNLSDKLDLSLKELRETNEKLRGEIELERQLDVMRRGFVADVSHELKTPLSIISGYAEGLKLNINSDSKDEYCNTIIDETERMNRLVLSILELSKYEGGGMKTTPEVFDISAVCRDMLGRVFVGRKDVISTCDIAENTFVFADVMQTEQILKSFIENAASHVSENGKVRVFAADDGNKLKVFVENTGKQIDPELMPRIWESFFRGDKSHNRDQSRFGLGLSIVSAIIKAQGEECGVYNTEDGVCFWFTCAVFKQRKTGEGSVSYSLVE